MNQKTAATVILLLLLILGAAAFARDPAGAWTSSPFHDWFAAAKNGRGQTCCTTSDGHLIQDGDWRMTGAGFEARLGGKWYPIEDWKVLKGNPTGRSVLWWTEMGGAVAVWCFAPGAAG